MKAQELRIGNWYLYNMQDEKDANGEWVKVPACCDLEDLLWLEVHPDDPDYLPIPITEGRVLELGLKKLASFGSFYSFVPGLLLKNLEEDGKWTLLSTYDLRPVGNPFHYVHELQNLYQGLMAGEELCFHKKSKEV